MKIKKSKLAEYFYFVGFPMVKLVLRGKSAKLSENKFQKEISDIKTIINQYKPEVMMVDTSKIKPEHTAQVLNNKSFTDFVSHSEVKTAIIGTHNMNNLKSAQSKTAIFANEQKAMEWLNNS